MTELIPEAFDAAWNAHPLPDPKYEVWIKLFLSDAIKAYLEHPAAGLVPRSEIEEITQESRLQNDREWRDKLDLAKHERDEALRQLAALRAALYDIAHGMIPKVPPSDDRAEFRLAMLEWSQERAQAALTDTAEAAAQYQRVPEITGDPDMPNLELCSFIYLADELHRRGATVTPAPDGGDFAAAAPDSEAEPE